MEYEIRSFTVFLENAFPDDEDPTATYNDGPRRVTADSKEGALAELYRLVGEERKEAGHTDEYKVFADPENIVCTEQ